MHFPICGLIIAALLAMLSACTASPPPERKLQQAGQGMRPVEVAAQIAATQAAAIAGDQARCRPMCRR